MNEFLDFCEEHGIRREFSTARTPQQNVVERMNKTVQQMARAMLDEARTPATCWVKWHLLQLLFSTKQMTG